MPFEHTQLLPLSLSLPLSPICLMPSLSSISSCTLGMSMCNRGPWGGPFTGVSKLRLFLLVQKYKTHTQKHSQFWKIESVDLWDEGWGAQNNTLDFPRGKWQSYLISISARLLASGVHRENNKLCYFVLTQKLIFFSKCNSSDFIQESLCCALCSSTTSFIPFLSSPLSLFSLFSLRFLRMMKSNATPRVTKITGQPMENSFLTSSFFSRGDLIGGIVPARNQKTTKIRCSLLRQ